MKLSISIRWFALGCALGACACAAVKAETAESSYLTEQLLCVDNAKTIEESHACRAGVSQKWAARDAGADHE